MRLSFPSARLDICNFNCSHKHNSIREKRVVKKTSKNDTKDRIYITRQVIHINYDVIKRYLNIRDVSTRDLFGWTRNNLVIDGHACEGKRNENFRRV